jgi:pimeloyl-ACP methyl ester carboxylesterase
MNPSTKVGCGAVICVLILFIASAGCAGTPQPSASANTGITTVPTGETGTSQQPDITKAEIKNATVDDITIAYKEIGTGEPLILIMGSSGALDLWDPRVVNELAQKYRVIVFDNRGMGHSTSSEKEYTIRLFANDTAGLMDALGIEKADVMGWSMGTNIAQELALDYPGKVGKLILYAGDTGGKEAIPMAPKDLDILMNTTGTSEERGMRLFAELFPPAWLKENPDPSKYFPLGASMSPPDNVRRQNIAIAEWNGSYSRLPSLKQPLLLIAGDQDVLTPPGNSLLIAGQVPQSWVVRMRGGGHGLMYQYPDAFSQTVLTFLAYGS